MELELEGKNLFFKIANRKEQLNVPRCWGTLEYDKNKHAIIIDQHGHSRDVPATIKINLVAHHATIMEEDKENKEEMSENYGTERMGWTHINLEVWGKEEKDGIICDVGMVTNLPKEKFIGLYRAIRTEIRMTTDLRGNDASRAAINLMFERNYMRRANSKATYSIRDKH